MDFVVPEKELKKSKKQNRVDSGFADGEDKSKSQKGWKSLNEPGVIDPRGVLASKYPLRPSGHRKGESGKKYVTEHVKRQKAMNTTSDQQLKRSKSFSDMARRIFRLNPASTTSVPKDKEKATTGSETGGTAEPTTESKTGDTAEPTTESKTGSTAEAITEAKTEGTAKPTAESKTGGTAEPTTELETGGTAEPSNGSKTGGTAEPTAEPTREEIESMLPPGPNPEDLPDHLKPETLEEGSLLMRWSGWLTREYDFKWGGTEFVWKGTGTVRDEKKYWGALSRYNHLKLVAKIPVEPEEKVEGEVITTIEAKDDKKGPQISIRRQASFSSFVSTIIRRNSNASQLSVDDSGKPRGHREVVIAKYTCLLATRKCGRLIIYEKALQETAYSALEGHNPDVARERLRHVVVATGLCMLQGEKQKRDTMREIAQAALGEIGGVAG